MFNYKRFLIAIGILCVVFLGLFGFTYALSTFQSIQEGTSPVKGSVLQTDGSASSWVATSTLGISGGANLTGTTGQVTYFNGTNSAIGTSSIFIASTGNVGIGTTSPSNKLHVYTTTSADGISVDGNNNPAFISRINGVAKGYWTTATSAGGFFAGSLVNDMIFRSEQGGRILLGVDNGAGNATPILTLSSGRAGIGTTIPDDDLNILASSGQDRGVHVKNTGTGAADTAAIKLENSTFFSTLFTTTAASAIPLSTGFYTAATNGFLVYPNAKQALRVKDTTSYFYGDGDAGKVGIGTSSPFSTLSVSTGVQQDGLLPLFTVASTTNTNLLTVLGNGNVGIGTNAPNSKLQISDSVNPATTTLGDVITTGRTALVTGLSAVNGGYASMQAVKSTGSFYGDIALQLLGGHVGIGTSTPGLVSGEILDVQNAGIAVQARFGDIYPFYLIANSPNLGFNTYYKANWKYGAGSVAKYGGIIGFDQNTGNTFFSVSPTAGNADSIYTPTTNVVILQNGNMGLATATPASKLSVSTAAQQSGLIPLFSVASTTNATLLTVLGNGNVGVGTNTPSQALSVNGGLLVTASSTHMNGINLTAGCYAIGGTCIGSGSGSGTVNSGTAGQTAYYAANGAAVSGSPILVIGTTSPDTDNVGIGSSTPIARLTVKGKGISTGRTLELTDNNDTPILTVFDNTFVGIGTENPTSRLTVAGSDIQLDADQSLLFKDPSNVSKAVLGYFSDTTYLDSNTDTVFRNTGNNESMRITGAGNVGIGTATPGSLLSVKGIANFTTATSSFYSTGGLNLTAGGCYAIKGNCIGGSGGVTSVAQTVPAGMAVTGSPITTSGTLALSILPGFSLREIPSWTVGATGADYTTIQGALDRCGVVNGGTIVLTDTLYAQGTTGLTFKGSNCNIYGRDGTTTITFTGATTLFKTNSAASAYTNNGIHHVVITADGNTSGVALDTSDMDHATFDDIKIDNVGTAIRMNNTQAGVGLYNTISNVTATTLTKFGINGSSTEPWNADIITNVFVGCSAANCIGLNMANAQGNTITGFRSEPGTFSGTVGINVFDQQQGSNPGTFNNVFINPYLEGNAKGVVIKAGISSGLGVAQNTFENMTTEQNPVGCTSTCASTDWSDAGTDTVVINGGIEFSKFTQQPYNSATEKSTGTPVLTLDTLTANFSAGGPQLTFNQGGVNQSQIYSSEGSGGTNPFIAFLVSIAGTLTEAVRWDKNLHEITSGTVPGISSCGTSPTIAGNDSNMRFHVGSTLATSCLITFNKAWTNAPICSLTQETGTGVALDASSTPTTVTISGGTFTSDWFTLHCSGY